MNFISLSKLNLRAYLVASDRAFLLLLLLFFYIIYNCRKCLGREQYIL